MSEINGISEMNVRRLPSVRETKPCDDISSHALTGFQIGMTRARMIIGAAIFSVPMFMTLSGWFGLVVLFLGSGVMLYTGMLLGWSLDALKAEGNLEPSYGDIGDRLVGPILAPVFTAFCVTECFVVVIFLLVFVGNAVGAHLGLSISVLIWPTAALGLACAFVPLRFFAVVGVAAIVSVTISVTLLVVSGVMLLPDGDSSQTLFGAGISGTCAILGGVAVGTGDHATFPGMRAVAQDSRAYSAGIAIGYCIYALMILVLCAATYGTFGASLKPVALNNIGVDIHGHNTGKMPTWCAPACIFVLTAKLITVMPIFMKPVITTIQELLLSACSVDITNHTQGSEIGLLWDEPKRFAKRACVWTLSFFFASLLGTLFADDLEQLMTLTSAVFKSVNVFIVPCFGFLKLCGNGSEVGGCQRLCALVVGVTGIVYGISGTWFALSSMLMHLQ